jgi:hypothetical protein
MGATLVLSLYGKTKLRMFEKKVLRISRPKTKEVIRGKSAMRSFIICIPSQILLE